MSIGEKINKFRNKLNLTQQELANSAGISLRALCNYEKGIRTPPLEMLIKISKVLGVDVKDLDKKFHYESINLNNSIGEKIKYYRKKSKLTQIELGEKLSKSESTIRKYEGGYILPPINVINDIAEVLDVDNKLLITDELVEFDDILTTELKEFITSFQEDFLDISNRNNIIYDKGFLDGLKKALQIIEGED